MHSEGVVGGEQTTARANNMSWQVLLLSLRSFLQSPQQQQLCRCCDERERLLSKGMRADMAKVTPASGVGMTCDAVRLSRVVSAMPSPNDN